MNKILITGVAGFIGSHVSRRFISEGYQVVGVDDLSGGRIENIPDGVQFVKGDLADVSTIERLPVDCGIILHLAGQSSGEISFDDPVDDLRKNTVSTLNLIRYGIRNHVQRIVYASSMSVYGATKSDEPASEEIRCSPLSCYGVGKLASEGYFRVYQNQLPFVVLRMFNVYGPGQDMSNMRQGMVSIFLSQALSGSKIHVKGSTGRYRDFIYIDDVVEIWYRSALYPDLSGHIMNVGTGVKTTVGTLLNKICDLVPGSNYFVQGATPGDQTGIYADTSSINKILGMNSFCDLQDGLQRFLVWSRALCLAEKK
jgi:UDP-glucose 4-epimerase